ncbi:MAG TPA: hypothetical protein ENG83_02100 [Nitrospirae bacterium]|nr:hypothetical protein BMS3Bbin15_00990 [archaeon BMS3Bbin15]HDH10994.1 hypothetical protein [Nitrospirota bacterium]
MNIVKLISFSLMLILVSYTQQSFAKTYAYLIGTDGKVTKIDADADTIVANLKIEKSSYVQSGETSVVADKMNNHLFVVTGRLTPYIYVYDLKKLKFIKDIGIESANPDVDILISPNRNQLFINWFVKEKGGWVYDLYDAESLSRIKRFSVGEFVWGPKTTFSHDGGTIYVYNGATDKIQIYETTNFTLLDSIDLNTIWKTNGYLSGIEDSINEKILIRETKIVTQDSPPEVTYFVYDLKTKTSSPKIITIVAGEAKLSLDGAKIFIHDEDSIWSEDKSYVMYHKSLGRLYVYDIATGKKWGFIQFTVDRESDILGIHPNGNKVYMKGDIQGNRSLIVMDVVKLQVLKTLRISENILFMIFYEE